MALVMVMIQAVTGVLLKFVYSPFPGRAYESIIILQNEVLFGQLIRNIHYWSAILLIIFTFLHLLRVYFTGAFYHPRQFNWVIGLCLFFLVIFSNFTGYLLPWDQLAFWAVTICTSMVAYIPWIGTWLQKMIRGGAEVGPASLSIFYAFHTVIIPICIFILMAFHFWRVRKASGVVIPRSHNQEEKEEREEREKKYVSTIPNLVVREVVVGLILVAFILVLALLFNAPLGDKANPGLSPNPTKAPWYFVGIQELLLHFFPLFAVLIIPVFITAALFLLPYLKYDSTRSGTWFHSVKGRRMGITAAATALVLTPTFIIANEFFFDFEAWLPGVPTVISSGLIPVSIVLAAVSLLYQLVKKKYSASKNEAIQALFILLLTGFIIITITGMWFRGEGMALAWPWK